MKQILKLLLVLFTFSAMAQSGGCVITKTTSGTLVAGSSCTVDNNSLFYIRTITPNLSFTIPTPTAGKYPELKIFNDSISGSVTFSIPQGVIQVGKAITIRWSGTTWKTQANSGNVNVSNVGNAETYIPYFSGTPNVLKTEPDFNYDEINNTLYLNKIRDYDAGVGNADNTITFSDSEIITQYNNNVTSTYSLSKVSVTEGLMLWGEDVGGTISELKLNTLGVGVNTQYAAPKYGYLNSDNLNDNRIYQLPDSSGNIALTTSNIYGNAATVTTNANLTGAIVSTGNATVLGSFNSTSLAGALTDETGSGSSVFSNSPTLVTPNIGVATATSINKVAITAPASSATLTLANGSTLTLTGAFATQFIATATTNATLPEGTYTVAKTTDYQYFTSNGTWTKPTGAKSVLVYVIGGGGGGGSGRRGALSSVRGGGGGGGGGGYSMKTFDASILTSTVAITVGVGGTGGTAVTADNTDGNPGGNATVSAFGYYVRCTAGSGSNGGTTAGSTGSSQGFGNFSAPSGGGNGSATGGAGVAPNNSGCAPTGGGSGGGVTALDAQSAGGQGATIPNDTGEGVRGAAGTSGGGNGGNATNVTTNAAIGGSGGGGGGSSNTGTGGTGGNGALYGGGGGGGGASSNGNNSGAGGNGANGIVIVITYF